MGDAAGAAGRKGRRRAGAAHDADAAVCSGRPVIGLEFTGWRPFRARKNSREIKRWLRAVGDASVKVFKGGMGKYPPASAPGAWPNIRSGKLRASIKADVVGEEVIVSSNTRYASFLRTGTTRMARRKMSDNALQEGSKKARLNKWAGWFQG